MTSAADRIESVTKRLEALAESMARQDRCANCDHLESEHVVINGGFGECGWVATYAECACLKYEPVATPDAPSEDVRLRGYIVTDDYEEGVRSLRGYIEKASRLVKDISDDLPERPFYDDRMDALELTLHAALREMERL